ncbi:TPA: hypothetical protein N0F65_000803 [Lagenidium giganteum]|uniref:Peptidase S74 domain-containing protein n=1 Tax=Lagenidium giganteum TaxID=4803 RepID=A0AAV2ZHT4_9STRA|nr:TPA: hypothetical protein N0F65_000803 [Lagenidium giganteum]
MMRLIILCAVAAGLVLADEKHCPGSPNQCSLHGACVINKQGEHVCNCQWGYNSFDCAKKMCPHGVDPTSPFKEDKKLRLLVDADKPVRGNLILSFHLHSVEFELPLTEVTSDACALIFRRFQNLGDLTCERTHFVPPATATYEITLRSFPIYPIMNNLYHHNGNPSASEFWCEPDSSLSPADAKVSCKFESVTDQNIKEYLPCSNHGVCNDRIGVCTCAEGYYGDNCASSKDEEDILVAPSKGPFFQGNVLRVTAKRGMSKDFNLIKTDIDNTPMLTVDGTGDTTLHHGSLTIKAGDLIVGNGNLYVQRGAGLVLDHADTKIHNGRLHIQQQQNTARVSPHNAVFQLDFVTPDNTAVVESVDLLRVSQQSAPLFRVSSTAGTVIHNGGLEVWRGGVKVQRGGIHVLSEGVQVLNGGVTVQNDDVTVKSGKLTVQDGATKLRNSQSTTLHVEAAVDGSKNAPSVAVEIETRTDTTAFLRAKASNQDVAFEVKGTGETVINGGGLRVNAGGIQIASGGQTIASGGLRIQSGGLQVDGGDLTVRDGFQIEDGGLKVQQSTVNGAALTLTATNAQFSGSVLSIDTSMAKATAAPFNLLAAQSSVTDRVFSIDSTGKFETIGDITTRQHGKIIASGALVSEAQVVFANVKLVAAQNLVIPSSHSYVQVVSDGAMHENEARIDREHAYAGQILVIQNEDEQPLTGDINVKPYSAAIFVYDGESWRALTAASFDTSVITGVKQFEAANDLNLGEIKLTAQNIQVGSQRAGYVAVYGKGGELIHDDTLVFDSASSTLSVETFSAKNLRGRIDMSESELRAVEIVGGHISNVNMTSIELVEVQGELFVEAQAYFGASITVDGQVMGSGAYVDASDKRFKRDIEALSGEDAVQIVEKLQAVEYAYRTDEFPEKQFPTQRELGFLAQDVEQVAPSVVTDSEDGFKYVAYSRLVPVAIEAIKETRREQQEHQQQIQALRQQVADLQALVRQLMEQQVA